MINLLHGSCNELVKQLENNSINVTVTSPPYNKHKVGSSKQSLEKKYIPGKQSNGIFKKIEYDNFDDSLPEEEYQQQQIDLLNNILTKTADGGSLFYNHKVRYLKGDCIHPITWLKQTDWHIREEIIWSKPAGTEISGYRFIQTDERIYWLCKGPKHPKMPRECANYKSVWHFPPDMKNKHPAPYPLLLPLRCIQAVLSEPGVVLDPYNGSGTTGVAATLLKHDYIGMDLSENYLKESEERISNPTPRDMQVFVDNNIGNNNDDNPMSMLY